MSDDIQSARAYIEAMRGPAADVKPGLPAASYPDFRGHWRNNFDAEPAYILARHEFITEYGFVLLTQEVIGTLAKNLAGMHVLEAGAGTGYLASRLADAGIPISACDHGKGGFGFQKQWIEMLECDAVELLPGEYDAVILSWPDYDSDFGFRVISAMKPGQVLIYQGEGPGGCTGNDQFHDELMSERWFELEEATNALNTHHRQFPGIHDWWCVYQKA